VIFGYRCLLVTEYSGLLSHSHWMHMKAYKLCFRDYVMGCNSVYLVDAPLFWRNMLAFLSKEEAVGFTKISLPVFKIS